MIPREQKKERKESSQKGAERGPSIWKLFLFFCSGSPRSIQLLHMHSIRSMSLFRPFTLSKDSRILSHPTNKISERAAETFVPPSPHSFCSISSAGRGRANPGSCKSRRTKDEGGIFSLFCSWDGEERKEQNPSFSSPLFPGGLKSFRPFFLPVKAIVWEEIKATH